MWTKENRGRYDRSRLRYPSDLTDEEWALVEPLIASAKRGGNKRTVDVRQVINGLMYVLSTGCQWRAIPKDLPPRSAVHDYFDLWAWDGTLDRIHHALYVQCRELVSREPSACFGNIRTPISVIRGQRFQQFRDKDSAKSRTVAGGWFSGALLRQCFLSS